MPEASNNFTILYSIREACAVNSADFFNLQQAEAVSKGQLRHTAAAGRETEFFIK
jgi:hypothetical protein